MEIADASPPERGEVAEDAEVGADVASQGANVRPGRAVDLNIDIDMTLFCSEADVDDLEGRDLDAASLEFDILTGADAA